MTTLIKLKKSSISGNIPDSADLAYGELALNFADGKLFYKNSSNEIKSFVDSALVEALISKNSVDSAEVINLIDSAYIQARQLTAAIDSADIINIVDSAYVQNLQLGVQFNLYEYNATNGQTTFQDSDISGQVLTYSDGYVMVHYNGVLLSTTDYTATDGSSVVLDVGADSGATIMIAKFSSQGQSTPAAPSGGASGGGSSTLNYGDRALVFGGTSTVDLQNIDYFDITSTGNASDFGDLSTASRYIVAAGNASRSLAIGGDATNYDRIEYVASSTLSNSSAFGDLGRQTRNGAAVSDASTVLISTISQTSLETVTIATTGNATTAGDLVAAKTSPAASSNKVRAVWIAGGSISDKSIDYLDHATMTNAADFGDYTAKIRQYCGGAGDETYAIAAGGYSTSDSPYHKTNLMYISYSTLGNASVFASWALGQQGTYYGNEKGYTGGTSNWSRAVFTGGKGTIGNFNDIEYLTISTLSSCQDFGDLTSVRRHWSDGTTSGAA